MEFMIKNPKRIFSFVSFIHQPDAELHCAVAANIYFMADKFYSFIYFFASYLRGDYVKNICEHGDQVKYTGTVGKFLLRE